tara:strand:- start:96 stop:323 length:228 start_codon:yes stop_codon:yes gene_type:complete
LTAKFRKNSINGEFGKNISVLLTSKNQEIKGEQNLVFMGFGINLSDKGINVIGKTVIIASVAPDGVKIPVFNIRE